MTRFALVVIALAIGFIPTRSIGAEAPHTRVAILNSLHASVVARNGVAAFVEELRRFGYVDGVNLIIDSRNADDDSARLPDLARELIAVKPDVILTAGTVEATAAAMKATSTIPIVFVHAIDPVRTGLVASLARPGGNVTGVTSLNADLGAKRLELIAEMAPGIRRIAVLASPVDPETPVMLQAVASAARTRRIQLDVREIKDPARLANVIGDATKAGAGAVLVLGSPPLYGLSQPLAQLALKHRLPTVSAWQEFPEKGGLASYGTDIQEVFQRAAGMVDRIAKGAKPADLPVEQPTKFDLVVNLKTAKILGLKIPEPVLLRANEVVR